MTDTFCIFPWIHQHITTTGNVLPCCTANFETPLGNIKENTIEEIWNNENYRQLRLNMLNGIESEHCKTCYMHEKLAPPDVESSFRKGALREFKEYINLADLTNEDGSLSELSLKYFDVRFSNICNFKCRTCSDSFSSAWAQENNSTIEKDNPKYKIFIKATDNNDKLLKQFKPYFKDMKVIYFAGGEPLITDEQYKILEYLIYDNATNITLRYNTNLSTLNYKNKKILEYWKKFKSVELLVSLDSWGTRAEYIRHGTVWAQIVDNIRKIKEECPHVKVAFNSVIGFWNCLTVVDFLEELEWQGIIDPNIVFFSLYKQMHPEWQNLKLLPLELRKKSIKKIDDYISRKKIQGFYGTLMNNLENLKEYMSQDYDNNLDLRNKLKEEIDRVDLIRNESFVETFPELEEFYESLSENRT